MAFSTSARNEKLKSKGKIPNEEFTARIEENKKKLNKLTSMSHVPVETTKIIRARAAALYSSSPKIPKHKNEKSQ